MTRPNVERFAGNTFRVVLLVPGRIIEAIEGLREKEPVEEWIVGALGKAVSRGKRSVPRGYPFPEGP